jgi:hypothetical protein
VKTYFLVRNAIGAQRNWLTLFVCDDERDCESGRRRAVPYCIGDEVGGGGRNLMEHVSMAMLLDYFSEEDGCERKARILTRQLANKLGGIGAGGRLLLRNKTSWSLTEKQLGDMVASILVEAKDSIDWGEEQIVIEEACGERRDLLRQAALVETISEKRFLN